MVDKLKMFIKKNNLVKPGDKVLLAVSGGIDSMVMAHLFHKLGTETGIAHCNFSLRSSESDKDEELVRKYAEENNITFFTIRFDTKAFAKKMRLSVQMAARELRYGWFDKIRKENNYDSVAVAHNLNDNIETFLINLTRGTGLSGLSGIKASNCNIIRPLLFASRQSISDYCTLNKIVYREDKSNAETKYTRNKIRHLVIPVLKEINPSLETTLTETSFRFTEISEIVSKYISSINKDISEKRGEFTTFNISLLKKHLQNKTILYELFKPFGLNNGQLNDLISITLGKTGGQIFTESHRIIRNRKELIVSQLSTNRILLYNIFNIREFKKAPFIISAKYQIISDKFKMSADPAIAFIDGEKISFPLIIRQWRAGDFFYPLGMNRRKKLSDYFIDKKYSAHSKESAMILESEGKIIWIIGDRLDNRFRISNSTKKALIIKVQGPGYHTDLLP